MSDVVEVWKNHVNTPDREGLVELLDEAVAEIERLREEQASGDDQAVEARDVQGSSEEVGPVGPAEGDVGPQE